MSDFLKGRNFIVVPRLTTTQRNALTATNGMLVYDTTANAFYKYENGAWSTFAGSSAAWGSITGTLSDQTDLQTALNAKQNSLSFTPENSANKKTSLSDNSDTFYPTQKAVKTAVDAKQDIPFAKSTTSSTTSSTSEVLITSSVLIPGGTVTVGKKLIVDARFTKTGLNGTSQPVIRIHTSATAGAGNKIAPGVSSFGASTIYIHYLKEGAVKSATNTEFGSQGLVNDLSSSTAAAASYNIDWTVDQYVNFCGLVASASDVLVLSEYTIYIE